MQQLVFGDGKENWAVILEETVEREGTDVYMDHKGRANCGCCNRDIVCLLKTTEKKLDNQI